MFAKIKGAFSTIKKANTVKNATSGNNEEAEKAIKISLMFLGIIILAPILIIVLVFLSSTSAFGYDLNMMQAVENNTDKEEVSDASNVGGSSRLTDEIWRKMLKVINELDGSSEDYYASGHDCSWFVYTVYEKVGISIPRSQCGVNVTECTDNSMYHLCYTNGSWTTDPDQMKPGYIVFFKNAGDQRTSGHVAIYGGVEDGKHIIYEDTTSRSYGSGIRKSNLEMYQGTSLTFLGGGDPTYVQGGCDFNNKVVDLAEQYLSTGAAYANQMTDKLGRPTDCSGLTLWVYKNAGFDLNAWKPNVQRKNSNLVKVDEKDAIPGDLVFRVRNNENGTDADCTHAAIYVGDGQVIEETVPKIGKNPLTSSVKINGYHAEFYRYKNCQTIGNTKSVSSSYRQELINKAKRNGSETNYLITVDCSNFIMAILQRSGDSWKVLGTYPVQVGKYENGRSISMNWKQNTILKKYTNAGAGDNVNPWQNSIDGDQKGFSIHGGWGDVKTYAEQAGGRHDTTPGGIVCDNGPAKWIYDNIPLGTKVVVFDNVDPK